MASEPKDPTRSRTSRQSGTAPRLGAATTQPSEQPAIAANPQTAQLFFDVPGISQPLPAPWERRQARRKAPAATRARSDEDAASPPHDLTREPRRRSRTEPPGPILVAARKLQSDGTHAGAMRLGALAQEVFGGPRPAHWWPRKLAREVVDASLSPVVLDGSQRKTHPLAILGYALVGAPSSLDGTARTAGVAVRADARGHGLGRALIEQAATWARTRGLGRLRSLAEPHNEAFYVTCGYQLLGRRVTLQIDRSVATPVSVQPSLLRDGPDLRSLAEEASRTRVVREQDQDRRERFGDRNESHLRKLFGWIDEAWEMTAASHRRTETLVSACMRARVSDEGGSWLVHGLWAEPVFRELWPVALLELRARLDDPRPLLVYGIPAEEPGITSLIASGARVAQSFAVMERPT